MRRYTIIFTFNKEGYSYDTNSQNAALALYFFSKNQGAENIKIYDNITGEIVLSSEEDKYY